MDWIVWTFCDSVNGNTAGAVYIRWTEKCIVEYVMYELSSGKKRVELAM